MEKEIGHISHYFDHISVAGVEITDGEVAIGDKLHIIGHTTDFETTVNSIQIEHESVSEAKPGDNIGIKVPDKVREHDTVYKIVNE